MNYPDRVPFIKPDQLQENELQLVLNQYLAADQRREWVPAYHFSMVHQQSRMIVGSINLRIGNTDRLVLYRGHIGYGVKPEFRGHRYAARSVRLLLPLAAKHQLNPLWITCDPDNFASRRTCELVGAELVEIIDVPPDEEMYQHGVRQKCRYKLETT
ncbi:MAG: GNAT family N-acetyltransferase [Chroococcidiopsidaceae cyanobacterium CP_BM_ER_R8_30]|nr:GNAT family N-acetyltransferase [Chroococcidiopsidaceae cyanobacterium CP_BM_ER_R8_30]